ncbi:uncharacterized protein [Paramormyrops kingsleyae]|uniref:uncharacterized protein isoform X2 n=1 Tax=Paramormyrops kingsleyae TaxID=1676925 RepID=UPI003B97C775
MFNMELEMHGLIWLMDQRSKMDGSDLLTMLTFTVCHDLEHIGHNNAYQSVKEKLEGLPVTPLDRDKVTKPSSHISFIHFILFPLFTGLANLSGG